MSGRDRLRMFGLSVTIVVIVEPPCHPSLPVGSEATIYDNCPIAVLSSRSLECGCSSRTGTRDSFLLDCEIMRRVTLSLVVVAGSYAAASLSTPFNPAPLSAVQPGRTGVPKFELQSGWAKVPAKWKLGDVSSVAIDEQDNVWILHRPRTLGPTDLPLAAPPVLEFDSAGNFLQAWGGVGNGYEWPEREHGISIDFNGFVWIGGNNCAARQLPGLKAVNDDQLLKFTKTGKFVMQIGRSNKAAGNADTKNLHEPADLALFKKTNEMFVADGYGNHRVIVLDGTTGSFKRIWGAFGNKPVDNDQCPPPDPAPVPDDGTPGPPQFAIVHALRVSNDGLVYVGDRENKRVQVFTTDGKFINQVFINRGSPGASRTTGGLAFSADPAQMFLYVAGARIAVLDRKTLQVLVSDAGIGGHHIATDSKGNIYTAALVRGPQKLVFKGVS